MRELTQDETEIFIRLSKMNDNRTNEFFYVILKSGGWVLKAIQKRFLIHAIEVDKKVMIMVLSIGDGVVGKCAKYVDDIARICHEKNIKNLDLELFSKTIYPNGVPIF